MSRVAIYLDHNASSPLLPEARAAMVDALALVGNPSSVHGHGRALRKVVEAGRDSVAALTGANRGQVVFTGSGTEAITQAIVGGARSLGIDALVVGAGEHAAVLRAAEATGLPVITAGLDGAGRVSAEEIAVALRATGGRRLLVAVQAVNNETGVIQPLTEIGAMVGASPHYLFVDAVQALGRLPLDFAASPADMMAVSGHKIGGPAGIGALLVKAHADGARLIPGGGQEQGRRGGTESAALIAGFGAAAQGIGTAYDGARLGRLTSRLETGILERSANAVIFGAGAPRAGNVVNFAVPGIGSAVAMMALDIAGVSVSSGSACSSGKVGPSHVLAAMGIAPELSACALRVSLGWSSTDDDVDGFLAAFSTVVARHSGRISGRAA